MIVTWIVTTRSAASIAVGTLYGGVCGALPIYWIAGEHITLHIHEPHAGFGIALVTAFGTVSAVTLAACAHAFIEGPKRRLNS